MHPPDASDFAKQSGVVDPERNCSVYRGRSGSKDLMEKKRREICDD